ncbi:MAG: hypothetical protein RSF88_03195 [Lachnospiraceae bacterium]
MKPLYIKFSDERNKKYSIKTTIAQNENKKYVIKEAIFPEGKEHIANFSKYEKLLKQAYPKVKVCAVKAVDDTLQFEYISGKLLLESYKECMQKADYDQYKELLKYHKQLVLGREENKCIFHNTKESIEIFGELKSLEGTQGLEIVNFDATASNIIIEDKKPVFIDYEWVFEFSIPEELAVYHCIRDAYFHVPQLEKFVSLKSAMEELNIKTKIEVLEEAYKKFFEHVIKDKQGKSYAEEKIICLKKKKTIKEYIEDNKYAHNEWEKCAKNWKESCQANERLNAENKNIRGEWEKCADNWKKSSKENNDIRVEWEKTAKNWKECCKENEHIRTEWEACAKNWKASIKSNEELQSSMADMKEKYETLEKEYDKIINSNTWKMLNMTKKKK